MNKPPFYKLFTDGAARGNPGPAGAGWVLLDSSHQVIREGCHYLGELTNNQAEYQALCLALEEALKLNVSSVVIYCDSELMVRQVKGEYKVKNEGLKPWFDKVRLLLARFNLYEIGHVLREKNGRADELANQAIDEHEG